MRIVLFFVLSFYFLNEAFAQEVPDSVNLAEIRVTANLFEGKLKAVTGGLSVLNQTEMKKRDPFSLVGQLNSLPGIYMHNGTENTNRIVIRGIGSRTPYSSNRIKAYFNNIPLTNGDGVTTLEDLDVNTLNRIEVIKGPRSAIYGAGLGGVINIESAAKSQTFEGKMGLGSFNRRSAYLKTNFDSHGFKTGISINHKQSDGFRENNQYQRTAALFTAHKNGQNTSLQFTALASTMEAQIPSSLNQTMFHTTPEKAAPNWLAAAGFEENSKILFGATLTNKTGRFSSNKLTLFATLSESFEHRPFNNLSDKALVGGLREQFKIQMNAFHFLLGTEVFIENYTWETTKDEALLNKINEQRSYGNVSAMLNYEQNRIRLSGGVNVNKLKYKLLAQSEENDQYGYPVIVSPQLGFNGAISSSLNAYASFGHGFSQPSLEETLYPNGEKNVNLKPEQGLMTELGLRYSPNNILFVDVNWYQINLNDLLVTKRISEEQFMGINAGESRHRGIEILLNVQLLNGNSFPGKLFFTSSYTLSKNTFVQFQDEGVQYSGNNLPGIPMQQLNANLSWQPSKNWTINTNWKLVGEQYLNDSNTQQTDGFQVLDLHTNYQLKPFKKVQSTVSAGVNNVMNKKYASMILVNAPSFGGAEPRYYYPGLPRNFYFSVLFQLD